MVKTSSSEELELRGPYPSQTATVGWCVFSALSGGVSSSKSTWMLHGHDDPGLLLQDRLLVGECDGRCPSSAALLPGMNQSMNTSLFSADIFS